MYLRSVGNNSIIAFRADSKPLPDNSQEDTAENLPKNESLLKSVVLSPYVIAGASYIGYTAGIKHVFNFLKRPFVVKAKELNLNEETMHASVEKMRSLYKKTQKTEINVVTPENVQVMKNNVDNWLGKNKQNRNFIKNFFHKKNKRDIINAIINVEHNLNAFCLPNNNKIFISKDDFASVLHEMGHAANKNTLASWIRLLGRFGKLYALWLLFITAPNLSADDDKKKKMEEINALIAKTKENIKKINELLPDSLDKSRKLKIQEKRLNRFYESQKHYESLHKYDERNLGIFEKIKDNIGKILLLCGATKVFEEGVASYKGLKAAKAAKLPQLSKLKRTYAIFLGTYVLETIAVALGGVLSVKVFDKLVEKKKNG